MHERSLAHTGARGNLMALDDLIERALPAAVYVPARTQVLRLLGKREPELDMLGRLVRRGGCAIDVGANKGTYTQHLLQLFDRVEAFEPIPACAALLERYARSARARLAIHECALGSEVGTARLVIPERRSLLFSSLATAYAKIDVQPDQRPASNALEVPVRRLDDYGFDDVRFIKIDVEGFERDVLAGAAATVAAHRPILLVEIEQRHLRRGSVADVVALVTDWEYRAKFLLDDRLVDFAEFYPSRHQPVLGDHKPSSGPNRYINNFFFFPA